MRLLIATDGSEISSEVIRQALTITMPLEREIRIVTVEPFVSSAAALYAANLLVTPPVTEVAAEQAAAILDQAKAQIEEMESSASYQVLHGDPVTAILEEAERWQANVLAIGSHGLGAIARFVLGSVSTAIAIHARCPVLLIHPR